MYINILNWHGQTKAEARKYYDEIYGAKFLAEELNNPEQTTKEGIMNTVEARITALTELDFDPENTALFQVAVCSDPNCGEEGTLDHFVNGYCPVCGSKDNNLQFNISKFGTSSKYADSIRAILQEVR